MAISGRNGVVTPPMTPVADPQPQHWEIRCREKQATLRCGDRVINFYLSAFDVNREFFAFGGYNSGSIELTAYTPSGARLSSRGWIVQGLDIECQILSQQFAMNDLARTEICLTPDRGSLAWEAEPPIYRFTVTPRTRTPQPVSYFIDAGTLHVAEVTTFSVVFRCFNPADTLSPADIDEVHSYLASEFGLIVDPSDRPEACQGCQNYHGEVYGGNRLICGIHPYGRDECPDRTEVN